MITYSGRERSRLYTQEHAMLRNRRGLDILPYNIDTQGHRILLRNRRMRFCEMYDGAFVLEYQDNEGIEQIVFINPTCVNTEEFKNIEFLRKYPFLIAEFKTVLGV